jgi:rubrerythrin
MLQNVWIRENKAVSELIKKLRDDERRHHDTLNKLSEKTFFRLDPTDFTAIMRGVEFAEERYRRSKEFWSERKER